MNNFEFCSVRRNEPRRSHCLQGSHFRMDGDRTPFVTGSFDLVINKFLSTSPILMLWFTRSPAFSSRAALASVFSLTRACGAKGIAAAIIDRMTRSRRLSRVTCPRPPILNRSGLKPVRRKRALRHHGCGSSSRTKWRAWSSSPESKEADDGLHARLAAAID